MADKPNYVIRITEEEQKMRVPIIAKCDDCGKESEQADLYDAPWSDNKVRCVDCFLKFCGYDLDAVNEWAELLASIIRKQLAEVSHMKVHQ